MITIAINYKVNLYSVDKMFLVDDGNVDQLKQILRIFRDTGFFFYDKPLLAKVEEILNDPTRECDDLELMNILSNANSQLVRVSFNFIEMIQDMRES